MSLFRDFSGMCLPPDVQVGSESSLAFSKIWIEEVEKKMRAMGSELSKRRTKTVRSQAY